MKKNLLMTVWCFLIVTAMYGQHIPTLEEAVYGGLIKTHEQITHCLEAGACAVTLSDRHLAEEYLSSPAE